jgi:hypothetical protein|tara:strand:- start:86 stop:217 length:132 start_codon:yes stop_codon:yes gene_type:complete
MSNIDEIKSLRGISSKVECCIDIAEVVGALPTFPTIISSKLVP